MNGSYRALLIGVPAYRDPGITDLPFVKDDMAELAEALGPVGYQVHVHDVDETDRESIDDAVEAFFQSAAEGQTLLLYLSGHGIHHGGKDYLVPKGARLASHDFRGKCLSLDFSHYVERSHAGDVIVFVDACREGVDQGAMSVGNTVGWSNMRVRRVGERHYCHVYACSPGERAHYTRAGNSTFSVFSRALSTVVAEEAGPSTLRELRDRLQSATDTLTAEHGLFRQQIRVRTETETDDFVVFVRPDRTAHGAAGEHGWVKAARKHPAWHQVGDADGAEAMHAAAMALVARIARQSDRDEALLAEDPWRPAGFAERMAGGVGWLLTKVINPEKLALSPAEAVLLVTVPYLYVACANRAAVRALEVGPTNLGHVTHPSAARASYEQFLHNRQRLTRRAVLAARPPGGDDHAAGIAWWLFRRWLTRKPGGFEDELLNSLIGPVENLLEDVPADDDRALIAELFELGTLPMLLRSLRTSFDSTTIRPRRQLAGGAEVEQQVREQLLVVLLTVAHHLAIDPILLPDVVVEHLGISYSVDMEELHRTLRSARWHQHGRTRVLNADCHHPAIGLALRQQAAALDALLGAVDIQAGGEPQLEPLQDLPAHATADQVRPAVDAAGKPAYESTDLRFRLADDRIQELLMGEQLYGDPALAVRELYQNALDACRYRQARTAYLRRRHPELPDWSGRITFRQGVDGSGRAYIECTDNGIGMGERELREVFSHAGMSFADLPEYLDEQAEWRKAGIEIHPNSRFGIGVLSYFMIADDISVTTCRMDREGHPGRRLQVDIAGPGSLFRIRDLGRGHEAQTTVRLYLRPSATAPSCTDLLRRLLWISEYSVVAEDAETRYEWEPDVLSPVAPLGGDDPHNGNASRFPDTVVGAASRPDVWWTNTHGGVLADGVWIGVPLFGAVVNLTGKQTPKLTVDRRRALSDDTAYVLRRLHEEIPALLRPRSTVFGHDWLSELVGHHPALADAIAEAAVACRYAPWGTGGHELDITAVGCFPPDAHILSGAIWTERTVASVPRSVVEWRIRAGVAAGAFPGVTLTAPESVVRARPTDTGLLRISDPSEGPEHFARLHYSAEWLDSETPVPLGHVLEFAHIVGCSPREAADRLVELGFRLPAGTVLPEEVLTSDLLILSRDVDGDPPWLGTDPVPLGHVMVAAERTKRRPAQVAARLGELGLRLTEGTVLPETAEPGDSQLLGGGPALGVPPWLDTGDHVPLGRVLSVAQKLERRPADVVARLTELGLRLRGGAVLPAFVEPEDLIILRRGGNPNLPMWWSGNRPVPLAHVLVVAHSLAWAPRKVAARLEQLGLRLHEGAVVPEAVDPGDLDLLVVDGSARKREWVSSTKPLSPGHVLAAAERTKRRPAQVVARLGELGLRLPKGTVLPDVIEPDDLLISSEELDRDPPWLDGSKPVPLGHVLAAAERTKRSPRDVAARLAALGLRLTAGRTVPEAVGVDDSAILSNDVDHLAPWLDDAAPVPLSHVFQAAAQLRCRPSEVASRFEALGLRVADGADRFERIEYDDLRMLRDRENGYRWLDEETTVDLYRVFQTAVLNERPLPEVAHRFRELGLPLAGDAVYDRDQ